MHSTATISLFFHVSFGLLHSSRCNVNLYISNIEMQRILGFDAELYYVRQGTANWNAMRHELMIPETIEFIKLRWIDSKATPSSSQIISSMSTHAPSVVRAPTVSLPSRWIIPPVEEEFQVNITCRRMVDGSALVYLHLDNIHIENVESIEKTFKGEANLTLSFNKLCDHKSILNVNKEAENSNHLIYEEDDDDDSGFINKTSVFYIAVAIACTTILLVATAVGLLHVHSMPKPPAEGTENSPTIEEPKDEVTTTIIPQALKAVIAEKRQKELMVLLKDFIVRRNLLSIGNTVQEGSFGRAYIGNLINAENGEELKVLVKTVTDQASPEQKALFLAESCLLKRITHHNVLPLMHVCFDEFKPPLVMYQYMNRGNLKNYLRLSRTAEPLLKSLTTRDIVLMALQIARGLQYLARRRILHKDVATRNCVVDEELNVKVCDNALARDFFPGDYHCLGDNENRPIRWMAVESLETSTFLLLSDVWSYGVLLWELCSLAQTPYANVDPFEMLSYLQSGLRLPQPSNCPDDFFTVMACCWALSPDERPHFSQIIACLEAFFNKLNAFI